MNQTPALDELITKSYDYEHWKGLTNDKRQTLRSELRALRDEHKALGKVIAEKQKEFNEIYLEIRPSRESYIQAIDEFNDTITKISDERYNYIKEAIETIQQEIVMLERQAAELTTSASLVQSITTEIKAHKKVKEIYHYLDQIKAPCDVIFLDNNVNVTTIEELDAKICELEKRQLDSIKDDRKATSVRDDIECCRYILQDLEHCNVQIGKARIKYGKYHNSHVTTISYTKSTDSYLLTEAVKDLFPDYEDKRSQLMKLLSDCKLYGFDKHPVAEIPSPDDMYHRH